MLFSTLTSAAALLALLLSVSAVILAVRAARIASTQTLANIEKSRLASIEAEITELTDSYDALLASHKKLRSRIGMRQNRERASDPGEPDWRTDPGAFKRAMRLKHLR